MKTIKTLCFTLLALTYGCSGDDDNGTPEIQYADFPITITKTSTTDPGANRSFNFTYNNENQISNISIVLPEGEVYRDYELSYSNGNLIRIADGDFGYTFAYSTENRLNNLVLDNGVVNVTVPVTYDENANTYSLTLEGTSVLTVDEGETMPLSYMTESTETTIAYTTMDGVFKDLEYHVALGIFFGGNQGIDYFFFHPFALQGILFTNETETTEWTITNSQDGQGKIVQVNAATPFASYAYSIEYEQREP
ncbi:hypothetical protein [Flagellimonas amoyensis]|uniref:hypothetical protein n=1 Tax=Flagellimonas amoyensis TaxID=2169401 RepID=UPI00131F3A0B|nr:hypothetical protein [Allomuricauda amoyensis]